MLRILLSLVLAAFAFAAQASVDANKATQAELQTIKGIGPGLSTKILAARKAGEFKNWPDMVERVSGIGPGNAQRFSQAGLTVGNASYSGQPVATAAAAKPAAAPAKAPKADAAAAKPAAPR